MSNKNFAAWAFRAWSFRAGSLAGSGPATALTPHTAAGMAFVIGGPASGLAHAVATQSPGLVFIPGQAVGVVQSG